MSIYEELAEELEVGSADVARFLTAAPARYRVFTIPKRNGEPRTIAQPSRTLKQIQRYVLRKKLIELPVHPASAAYVVGRGIADNARLHRHSRFITKLDFEAFFPSLTVRDWRLLTKRREAKAFLGDDAEAFERILFWGAGSFQPKILSIGAPTSPYISNALMFDIDSQVSRKLAEIGVTYSRYADDITLSGPDLRSVQQASEVVKSVVRKTPSPRLKFNMDKAGTYGRGERRMVTGLVITPQGSVSLGRERKRRIAALLHQTSLKAINVADLGLLKGLLGFAVAAEPEFLGRMRRKYGDEVVDFAMKYELPPKAR